jgi:hypothetical protein
VTRKRLVRIGLIMASVLLLGLAGYIWLGAGSNLNVTITLNCKQRQHKLGDPIPITYTINNEGESEFPGSPHWYERIPYFGVKFLARMPSYYVTLSVQGNDGRQCARPWWSIFPYYGCAIFESEIELSHGESYSRELILNDQVIIGGTGTYSVRGYLWIERGIGSKCETVLRSEPIEIEVERRSDEGMRDHISKLVHTLQTGQPSEAADAVTQLMYTRNSRVVPALLDLEYSEWMKDRVTDVGKALSCYLPIDPEIKNMLLEAAKRYGTTDTTFKALERYCTDVELKQLTTILLQSSDPNCLLSGADMAMDYSDESHADRLIQLAKDSNSEARLAAISALAFRRTEKGVEALRKLLEGSNHEVRDYTASVIGCAYFPVQWYRRPCEGISRRDLMRIVTEVNNPQRWDAMQELLYAMDYENLRLVRSAVNEGQRNIETSNSSEVLELIANILKSEDKDVRDIMITLIRLTERIDPERRLKPEDFPEIYEEYKKELESEEHD